MAAYGGYKIIACPITSRHGTWEKVAHEVERQVCELMLQGWEPYFGLIAIEDGLIQAMLWNGEDEDGNPTRPPA